MILHPEKVLRCLWELFEFSWHFMCSLLKLMQGKRASCTNRKYQKKDRWHYSVLCNDSINFEWKKMLNFNSSNCISIQYSWPLTWVIIKSKNKNALQMIPWSLSSLIGKNYFFLHFLCTFHKTKMLYNINALNLF